MILLNHTSSSIIKFVQTKSNIYHLSLFLKMKLKFLIGIALSTIAFVSCDDNTNDIGISLVDNMDHLEISTIHLMYLLVPSSQTLYCRETPRLILVK